MSQTEIEEELLKSVQTIKGIAGAFEDIIEQDDKVKEGLCIIVAIRRAQIDSKYIIKETNIVVRFSWDI